MPTVFLRRLAEYPLAWRTSGLRVPLILSFFVTSSDSGSLVVDSIASSGRLRMGVNARVFWASLEEAVAAILLLLLGGGLSGRQAVCLSAGLPFAAMVLFLCGGLLRTLVLSSQPLLPPTHPSRANRS